MSISETKDKKTKLIESILAIIFLIFLFTIGIPIAKSLVGLYLNGIVNNLK